MDAYVHLKLAHEYDAVRAAISQGQLFRAEAAAATLSALLLLLAWRPATRLLAFAVAASALAAAVVNTYLHLGTIGPLPDMYEPGWFTDKIVAVVAEGASAVTAVAYPRLWSRRRPPIDPPAS